MAQTIGCEGEVHRFTWQSKRLENKRYHQWISKGSPCECGEQFAPTGFMQTNMDGSLMPYDMEIETWSLALIPLHSEEESKNLT